MYCPSTFQCWTCVFLPILHTIILSTHSQAGRVYLALSPLRTFVPNLPFSPFIQISSECIIYIRMDIIISLLILITPGHSNFAWGTSYPTRQLQSNHQVMIVKRSDYDTLRPSGEKRRGKCRSQEKEINWKQHSKDRHRAGDMMWKRKKHETETPDSGRTWRGKIRALTFGEEEAE